MARLRRAVPSGFPIEQFDVRFSVPDDTTEEGTPINLHIYRWRLSNGDADGAQRRYEALIEPSPPTANHLRNVQPW